MSLRVVELPYLAKLLLQHDDNPCLDPDVDIGAQLLAEVRAGRVLSCLRPDGDALAVAHGRRLVVVRFGGRHGEAGTIEFATATSGSEAITALVWVASHTQPADECILLGTSHGCLQLHLPSAAMLLRQALHPGPVRALHVRPPGSGLDPRDLSDDITLTWSDAVARLASWDVWAVVRWHAGRRTGGGWWASSAPPALAPDKWSVGRGVGPRTHAVAVGVAPPPLYTLMTGRKWPARVAVLTAGADPPLATMLADETPSPGLLSLVSGLAGTAASGLLRRGKGKRGAGPDAGKAEAAGEPLHLGASVWDEARRQVVRLSMSPCGRWAACCDSLGRVSLVDVAATMVLRVLKGYRDAQVAWLSLPAQPDAPPAAEPAGLSQPQPGAALAGGSPVGGGRHEDVQRTPGKGGSPGATPSSSRASGLQGDSPPGRGDSAQGMASVESSPAGRPGGARVPPLPPGPPRQLLVLLAPRRGVVELWRPLGATRLGALRLDQARHGLLLAQPCRPLPLSSALGGGADAAHTRPEPPGTGAPNAIWLLDSERLQAVELTDELLQLCSQAGAALG